MWIWIALIAVAACNDTPRAQQPPTMPPTTSTHALPPDTVTLTWSMARDTDRLRIDYTIENRSDAPIFVADRLRAFHGGKVALARERMIVVPSDTPARVRLVRGVVHADEGFDHAPGVVQLEPGAIHRGSASLVLPLRGWHNYAESPTLDVTPIEAILEIAYLPTPVAWAKHTVDGEELLVPQLPDYNRHHRMLVGDVQPIP
jgi:hypothetical protein